MCHFDPRTGASRRLAGRRLGGRSGRRRRRKGGRRRARDAQICTNGPRFAKICFARLTAGEGGCIEGVLRPHGASRSCLSRPPKAAGKSGGAKPNGRFPNLGALRLARPPRARPRAVITGRTQRACFYELKCRFAARLTAPSGELRAAVPAARSARIASNASRRRGWSSR
jgi:hypothetical protein